MKLKKEDLPAIYLNYKDQSNDNTSSKWNMMYIKRKIGANLKKNILIYILNKDYVNKIGF
jgi:hypothetical protein